MMFFAIPVYFLPFLMSIAVHAVDQGISTPCPKLRKSRTVSKDGAAESKQRVRDNVGGPNNRIIVRAPEAPSSTPFDNKITSDLFGAEAGSSSTGTPSLSYDINPRAWQQFFNDSTIAANAPAVSAQSTLVSVIMPIGAASPPPPTNSCPPNLRGVVLNAGYNIATIDTIGVADSWLSFSLSIYGVASQNAIQTHVPMMAFASDVLYAINLINSPSPPEYLLTFNEPDFSFQGTPLMTPQQAATAFMPLIAAMPGKTTKLIAPALSDSTSTWLDQFYALCGCKFLFSAYSMHVYEANVHSAEQVIMRFHSRYSDRPLWITQISPNVPQCDTDWNSTSTFMQEIYTWAHRSTSFVDRIFWGSGNQGTTGDTTTCKAYLTTSPDGSATPLLTTFQELQC